MVKKEGKQFISMSKSMSGEVVDMSHDHEGTGEIAIQEQVVGLSYVEVTRGRTVELAPYEFARFDVGMRVYVPSIVKEDVYAAVDEYVSQMVAFESEGLAGRPYEISISDESASIVSKCVGRSVTLSYGLTLKTDKKFESARIDVGRSKYISDDGSVVDAYIQIGDVVGKIIDDEQKKIKGNGTAGI